MCWLLQLLKTYFS